MIKQYTDSLTEKWEGQFPFVEGVTLADYNKRAGGGWQSDWHFEDLGFSGDGGNYNFKTTPLNITAAMQDLFLWLSGNSMSDSVFVNTIRKHTDSEGAAKGLGLRLIMHYMGDIHQPLHVSARYTAAHPDGDKGGNLFALKNHYSANELHAVWDEVMYAYHSSIQRPFTPDSFQSFGAIASDLRNQFTISSAESKNLNFRSIADKSHSMAMQAYDGITEGSD
jgi:hypothetical protein